MNGSGGLVARFHCKGSLRPGSSWIASRSFSQFGGSSESEDDAEAIEATQQAPAADDICDLQADLPAKPTGDRSAASQLKLMEH